ncbi:acyl carrier protein [Nocardia puris]|uniref:Phosphopantetheine binding protein n=1 Tax=Nocardia puris TaxID=208602 RepID=A0A366D121_9NOCA|nr:acyl carrier protein [Nocardia puris]MBF6215156.1 acyl carrier protein [Nocardia puris]MBF6369667.1 acyl carrier protein [Nocardia puris]MBF6462515.1 acyl carrier protein [Nocardia puris]RBO83605.1 phosphopantetheine binding protein [Nocardia puris]
MDDTLFTERRDWLRAKVAYYVEREPEEIGFDTPLTAYGLNSVFALTIAADIEDELGITVEPEVMWEHPTINALTPALLAGQKTPTT